MGFSKKGPGAANVEKALLTLVKDGSWGATVKGNVIDRTQGDTMGKRGWGLMKKLGLGPRIPQPKPICGRLGGPGKGGEREQKRRVHKKGIKGEPAASAPYKHREHTG